MSYINLVMALPDFFSYMEDLLEKEQALFLLEKKDEKGTIYKTTVALGSVPPAIEKNREQYLGFFIVSASPDVSETDRFYDDEIAPFVIEGEGGREDADRVERISLRILSKTPHKNTKKIFNAIRSRLKKDPAIGMGVTGGSKLHDDYFYQKSLVNEKAFKTDFYNDKAPVITPKSQLTSPE